MDKTLKVILRMNKSKFALMRKFYHYWLRIVYSCDIMPGLRIGYGCRFPHRGLGVVINQDAIIGNDVTIGCHVVIGGKNGLSKVPNIGNNVHIGASALLIGPITIGDNAIIGGGAVVVKDVEPNAVVAGNPAKVIYKI